MSNTSRRLARIAVSPSRLMTVLQTGWRVVADGLPLDADYRSAWYDRECEVFWIVCASELFDEVSEGAMIPALASPTVKTIKGADQ